MTEHMSVTNQIKTGVSSSQKSLNARPENRQPALEKAG